MAKRKTAAEIAAEMEAVRSELLQLDELDDPSDDEVTRSGVLLDLYDDLEAEHQAAEVRESRLEALRSAAGNPANREDTTPRRGPDVLVRGGLPDTYDNLDAVRSGVAPAADIIARALNAIEQAPEHMTDAHREAATALIERSSRRQAPLMARHMLLTGSPEYHAAFDEYLHDPQGYAARAALSLTSANGGYLVPFTLDPSVILTNGGSANPFRTLATAKTTATNTWNGVTSAGVNAGWLAEGTEDSDHSPTFGNLQIKPEKASAWVFGSYEILEDSDFATELPGMLADAKDRLEEAAFATGDGAGKPFGVVTRATAVASTTAATYAVGDVYKTQQALPARWRSSRSRPAWVANLAVINATRQFDTAGGSSFWANLGMGTPERLLGAPIHESTTMSSTPATTAAKTLLLGDFSQYLIVDRIGMSVMYEPMVKGANQRPTGQGGWFAFWRVGADVTTAQAFRVLTIG